jgi:hypothetical protein
VSEPLGSVRGVADFVCLISRTLSVYKTTHVIDQLCDLIPSIVNLAFGSTVNMPNSIAVLSVVNISARTYISLDPVYVSRDRNSVALL